MRRRHQIENQRTRRRWPIFICLLIIFVAIALYSVYAINATLPTTSPKLTSLQSLTQPAANLAWPDYGSGAVGAVGFDGTLAKYGDQSPRPIASITKVITALLVLQAKPINVDEEGPSIELTQADVEIYNRGIAAGAAVQPVRAGSSITERQALETILLPSAANYSETLAIWAYGSIDAYLSAANSWLADHNLSQTGVDDTSGLSPNDVSSPGDLIELGKLALANPALASIVATKQATIPDVGTISNSNHLLGKSGINGIKTGTTSAAGACMLFSNVITVGGESVKVVGVLLGADNRGQQESDVTDLLVSVEPAFRMVKLVSRNQEFASYKSSWGQTAKLISNKDVSEVIWADTPISIKVQADNIRLVETGERKGEVVINIGDKIIRQPLVVSHKISDPGIMWRLTNFSM